jgi:hypothetical protein
VAAALARGAELAGSWCSRRCCQRLLADEMVVKGRKPHRRACLCCAEGGALPFSLRRANGDTLLEDTWTLDDDDEAPPATAAATAEVCTRLA